MVQSILKTQGISEDGFRDLLNNHQVEVVDNNGETLPLDSNESSNWAFPITLNMWVPNLTSELMDLALNIHLSLVNMCLLCMGVAWSL